MGAATADAAMAALTDCPDATAVNVFSTNSVPTSVITSAATGSTFIKNAETQLANLDQQVDTGTATEVTEEDGIVVAICI